MRQWVASILLVLLATGCQYDPDANLYVTSPPNEAQVVGEYRFTSQRVNTSTEITASPRILLFADHRFQASNFPKWDSDGIASYKLTKYEAAEGTWKIDNVGGLDNGSGKEKPIYGIVFDTLPPARLTAQDSKRGLLFGYGDPDQGQSMAFELVGPPPPQSQPVTK